MEKEDNNYHFQQTRQDHDLMVRIDERLHGLVTAVNDLKDNLNARVANLEGSVGTLSTDFEASKRSFKVVWVVFTVIIIPLLVAFYLLIVKSMESRIKEGVSSAFDEKFGRIEVNNK